MIKKLTYSSFVFLLLMISNSCKNSDPNDLSLVDQFIPCTPNDIQLFREVEKGNIKSLEKLINSGGIDYYCPNNQGMRLSVSVSRSKNFEQINYYLSHTKITQEIKNEFLYYYVDQHIIENSDKNIEEIYKLILKKGGKISIGEYYYGPEKLDVIHKTGYNFNELDKDGNNFISKLSISCEEESGDFYDLCLIEIEYFISKGLDVNHKNNKGKTAIDLSKSKNLKNYLLNIH